MSRRRDRARACAAALTLSFGACTLRPIVAFAQDEEVIADPELSEGAGSAPSSDASGDEVIADPELGMPPRATPEEPKHDYGWGEVYKPQDEPPASAAAAATEEDTYDPLANTGIAKLEVLGQTAVDIHAEENMEDFYEARLRFGGEVDFRISRRLRLSLGTRLDFFWAAPHQSDDYLTRNKVNAKGQRIDAAGQPVGPGGEQARYNSRALQEDRYEVDIVPLSAYADVTVADGVHLRLGTQVISMGRMDGYSATDILAVNDLRPQPKLDPAAAKIAQPAVRLDWDINSWVTLQAVYVPWFMPHVTRPNRDQFSGGALTGMGSQRLSEGQIRQIDPSNSPKLTESAIRYLGPAPDFASPQAEARLNFRGGTYEFALVGGTALEKLPSVYMTPAVDQLMRVYNDEQRAALRQIVGAAADSGRPMLDIDYQRYYLVGVDGSFDLAPLQVSFEAGYSPERHLYASSKDGSSLPQPNTTEQICNPADIMPQDPNSKCYAEVGYPNDSTLTGPQKKERATNPNGNVLDRSIRKGVGVVQATLHVEWIKGETFALAAEAYLIQALDQPYDRKREWTGFIDNTGTFLGGLVGGNYLINEGQWRIDLTGLVAPGPSFVVSPQIELRVLEGFYLNLGAQLFEGPAPKYGPKQVLNDRVGSNVTLGGLFNGYDNVYLGFRYLP